MKLKWLGHSCFLITAQNGRTLMTDPFDNTVGYPMPGIPANVVTCSHAHFDHYAVDTVPTGYTLINQPGVHHTSGFVVEGISCFHDDQQGSLRGRNLAFVARIDDLRVGHMGDLGHFPTPAMLDALKGLDVLLIPVGGIFTLDGDEAARTVEALAPRLTIPMHYQTEYLNLNLNDASAFLSHFEHRDWDDSEIEITAANIDQLGPVVVLPYKN